MYRKLNSPLKALLWMVCLKETISQRCQADKSDETWQSGFFSDPNQVGPIAEILTSDQFKKGYLWDKERLRLPVHLSNRDKLFRTYTQAKKEQLLMAWSHAAHCAHLRLPTAKKLLFYGPAYLLLSWFLYAFVFCPFAPYKKFWKEHVQKEWSIHPPFLKINQIGSLTKLPPLGAWPLEKKMLNLLFDQQDNRLYQAWVLGLIKRWTLDLIALPFNLIDLGGENRNGEGSAFLTLLQYLLKNLIKGGAIIYIAYKLIPVWKYYTWINIRLVHFFYYPFWIDAYQDTERLLIRTAPLLSSLEWEKLIDGLILARKIGDIEKIRDKIKYYRARPSYYLPVEYNPEKIEALFASFSPEMKEKAHMLAMMVVFYSRLGAYEEKHGQGIDTQNIVMKPVLMVGPPSTGKTLFFTNLAEALGLPIALLPLGTLNFYGESDKKPGILMRAARKVANANKQGLAPKNMIFMINDLHNFTKSSDPKIINFLYQFLDPNQQIIDDQFLECSFYKSPFIFNTSNEDLERPLKERCLILEKKALTAEEKKVIAREKIAVNIKRWERMLGCSLKSTQKIVENKIYALIDASSCSDGVETGDLDDEGIDPGMRVIQEYIVIYTLKEIKSLLQN